MVGSFIIKKPILLWINDGLMTIYFMLIGLEIKNGSQLIPLVKIGVVFGSLSSGILGFLVLRKTPSPSI